MYLFPRSLAILSASLFVHSLSLLSPSGEVLPFAPKFDRSYVCHLARFIAALRFTPTAAAQDQNRYKHFTTNSWNIPPRLTATSASCIIFCACASPDHDPFAAGNAVKNITRRTTITRHGLSHLLRDNPAPPRSVADPSYELHSQPKNLAHAKGDQLTLRICTKSKWSCNKHSRCVATALTTLVRNNHCCELSRQPSRPGARPRLSPLDPPRSRIPKPYTSRPPKARHLTAQHRQKPPLS